MKAKQPKYYEMYDILQREIASGTYPPGSFLPTENALVARYGVSKTTIRHAVKLLKDNALVEVRQGSGTRILAPKEKEIDLPKFHTQGNAVTVSARYSGPKSDQIRNTRSVTDQVPASAVCAEALSVPEGTMVWRMQRMQRVGSRVFGYMVNYLSVETFPDLSSRGEITVDLYGHLKRQYGVETASSDERVTPVIAGFMEGQYLGVPAGTPLLQLCRKVTSSDGKPVEYGETLVRPDRFSLLIHTEYNV